MLLGEASVSAPPVKSVPGVKTGSKGGSTQETKPVPQKGGVTLGEGAVMGPGGAGGGAGGGMMAQLHAERLAREKEKAEKERVEKEQAKGKVGGDGKDGGKMWWEEESEAGAKGGKGAQKKKPVLVGNAVKVSEG